MRIKQPSQRNPFDIVIAFEEKVGIFKVSAKPVIRNCSTPQHCGNLNGRQEREPVSDFV